jgi:dipeptidyl-peptidase-4
VDASRIGIWGWSYGGHARRCTPCSGRDDLYAGFAGGPVTDWRYYDSIYTERHLGRRENEKGYQTFTCEICRTAER